MQASPQQDEALQRLCSKQAGHQSGNTPLIFPPCCNKMKLFREDVSPVVWRPAVQQIEKQDINVFTSHLVNVECRETLLVCTDRAVHPTYVALVKEGSTLLENV